jgi:hypothetical protein
MAARHMSCCVQDLFFAFAFDVALRTATFSHLPPGIRRAENCGSELGEKNVHVSHRMKMFLVSLANGAKGGFRWAQQRYEIV